MFATRSPAQLELIVLLKIILATADVARDSPVAPMSEQDAHPSGVTHVQMMPNAPKTKFADCTKAETNVNPCATFCNVVLAPCVLPEIMLENVHAQQVDSSKEILSRMDVKK